MIALWNAFPPVADLLAAASSYRYLVVCLTQSQLPPLILSAQPSTAERAFAQAWAKKHHPRWYREMMAKNAEADKADGKTAK